MPGSLPISQNLKAGEFYGKVSAKRSVSSSIISEIVHTRGKSLPKHSHELAFFTLLLDGSYSESYGRKNFSYRPMTVLWHPSDVSHKDEIGSKGGRFFSVEIQKAGLDTLKTYAKIPEDFYEERSSLVWLACRLYREFKEWQTCSELVAEGITLEMLAHSARNEILKEKKPPKWLDLVIEKLNDEFAETPTTKELANEANVHPVHLSAVFRRFQDRTIGEYLQELRVKRASQLLLDPENSLSDIAVTTGFADQSHFTRIFKNKTGMTPGIFRKNLC
ncbi:MAG: AraC family transcriptional regulator [Pyrinomonadaceae bacterium]